MTNWVDANDVVWRFSTAKGVWQKRVNRSWVNATLPTGGLRKVGNRVPARDAVVVETMGPEGPPGPPGNGLITIAERLAPSYQNGVNTILPLGHTARIDQGMQVFRNGLMEIPGLGYISSAGFVTFTTPPLPTDVITAVYQKDPEAEQ